MAELKPLHLAALSLAAVSLSFVGAPGSQEDPDATESLEAQAQPNLLQALRDASEDDFLPALETLYAEFRTHALALEFEEAIRLGRGMHEEVVRRGEKWLLTSGWSATQLGLAYTRGGDHAAAEAVLSERIEIFENRMATLRQEPPDPELLAAWDRGLNGLLNRRSMARLAAGDEAGGVADLGAGLARGSQNARLILGRRALRLAGKNWEEPGESTPKVAARRLFSTLLDEDPNVAAWALRGWGLTLLPASRPR